MSSSGLSSIAVGCELDPMESCVFVSSIHRATLPVWRLSSARLSPFHKLTQAFVPALLAITVYGYALGMKRSRLRSNDCEILPEPVSRTMALSERLLAMRRRSPLGPLRTASPAGYGSAVPAGVLRTPNATSFPSAMGWGAILMKRSGVTCPSANLYTAMPLPVLFGFSPVGSVIEPIEA